MMRIVGKEIMGKLPAPKQVELPPLLSHPLHFYPTAFTRNAALSPLFPFFSFLSLSFEKVKSFSCWLESVTVHILFIKPRVCFPSRARFLIPCKILWYSLAKQLCLKEWVGGGGTLYALSTSKPSWNDLLLVDTNGKKE